MGTQLDAILARTRQRVAERKADAKIGELERQAGECSSRGFLASLQRASKSGTAVIAELKKASPSRGLIRADYVPAELATAYAGAGAAALSVLTDQDFFQGSLTDLHTAWTAVQLPILRKDFIVDRFQVLEAKAAGADAILLIVAALGDGDLRDLAQEARQWSLDILCETHDRNEIERAVQLGFEIIGVNSRDLKTLKVSPDVLLTASRSLPSHVFRVAESGIRTREDIERLLGVGYDAFLVGEALMSQPDPGAALAGLLLPQEHQVANQAMF